MLESAVGLPSFADFTAGETTASKTVTLAIEDHRLPDSGELLKMYHKEMNIAVLEDGWQFSLPKMPEVALRLTKDRSRILCAPLDTPWKLPLLLPLLRTALECASAQCGVMSLHAACVEMDGDAICFTAPSGVGKSTRARQWEDTLGAKLISGDRPSLRMDGESVMVCGVPWDGKEGVYRNVQRPLKMICSIVRDDKVSARRLSRTEARQLLMQQCFLPMWDTEAAVAVMAVLRRVLDRIPVVELRCGPDEASAWAAYELIFHHPERILEETEQ